MREIKFREWDKHREEMYGKGAGMSYGEREDFDDMVAWRFAHEENFGEEPRVLMQFTGLKDKNGVDIYESDILSDGKELYLVKYSFTETGMIASGLGEEGTWSLYHLATNHNKGREIEVVGNIYQNSDLLKEGQTNG